MKNSRKIVIILSFESLTSFDILEDNPLSEYFKQNTDSLFSDFNRCLGGISNSDWTFPTAASNFFGLYPSQHGYTSQRILKSNQTFSYSETSLANIAKQNGFLTIGGVFSNKYSPRLGLSKGFDIYVNNPQAVGLYSPKPPDSDWIISILERYSNEDCFIFVHTDMGHSPHYTVSPLWARNTPPYYPTIKNGDLQNSALFYNTNIKKSIIQLHTLINYLKVNDQFDDTMMVVLGDHGHDLDDWRNLRKQYPLRESRIRVPYEIHWPRWSDMSRNNGTKHDRYREANIDLFKDLSQALGAEIPRNMKQLAQHKKEFAHLTFSESIDHPNEGDYFLAIRSNTHKYVFRTKIDYLTNRFGDTYSEYYFKIADERLILSEINLCKDEIEIKKFRQLAWEFLNDNLKYRSEYRDL